MSCTHASYKNNPQGMIILGVNIHCEGCANEVKRFLRGYEGVEGIEIDAGNNKVTVKGKEADPVKVKERLRKKSGKYVELISPSPQNEEKKEEKEPEPEVREVVLKIYMHCESCAEEVKHCILKMEGVQTVEPEKGENLVKVKGSMAPMKVVEFIARRGGRHAELVKQTVINGNDDCSSSCRHHSHHHLVYVPQLFSDENPNSCSLM